MSTFLQNSLFFLLIFFSISLFTNAQSVETQPNIVIAGTRKTVKVVGKSAVVIIGETAKATWKATKFAAAEIIEPTAKIIIVKAAPKATKFLLSQTGNAIIHGTPIAKKLLLTYLKL